ncbi:unnamed protein product [Closterium sp. NIES-54]
MRAPACRAARSMASSSRAAQAAGRHAAGRRPARQRAAGRAAVGRHTGAKGGTRSARGGEQACPAAGVRVQRDDRWDRHAAGWDGTREGITSARRDGCTTRQPARGGTRRAIPKRVT